MPAERTLPGFGANVVVDGKTNPDAAWFYPHPKTAAKQIEERVAFWEGVVVGDA